MISPLYRLCLFLHRATVSVKLAGILAPVPGNKPFCTGIHWVIMASVHKQVWLCFHFFFWCCDVIFQVLRDFFADADIPDGM